MSPESGKNGWSGSNEPCSNRNGSRHAATMFSACSGVVLDYPVHPDLDG